MRWRPYWLFARAVCTKLLFASDAQLKCKFLFFFLHFVRLTLCQSKTGINFHFYGKMHERQGCVCWKNKQQGGTKICHEQYVNEKVLRHLSCCLSCIVKLTQCVESTDSTLNNQLTSKPNVMTSAQNGYI